MTSCTRGVSDLGCGRGHDRRRGQISWSLTPRSYSLALSLPWRRLAVGGKRRPCSPSRKSPALIHLSGVTEAFGRPTPMESNRATVCRPEGEHPAQGPVPPLFPPHWRYIERAALNGRLPGTSDPSHGTSAFVSGYKKGTKQRSRTGKDNGLHLLGGALSAGMAML